MPELDFKVLDAEALPYAASPTLRFRLDIRNAVVGEQVQSIMLRTQIRIEPMWRHYDARSEARLLELFGETSRWGETLRTFLWTHATAIVPRFEGSIIAELPVACSYDFEVAAGKYFHALEDGEVPLLFLFSGTVFYTAEGGALQIMQIPWEKEAQFRLPVRVWTELMDHYFPNSAWLRVGRDVFDKLCRYKARRALPTWEATLEELLQGCTAEAER